MLLNIYLFGDLRAIIRLQVFYNFAIFRFHKLICVSIPMLHFITRRVYLPQILQAWGTKFDMRNKTYTIMNNVIYFLYIRSKWIITIITHSWIIYLYPHTIIDEKNGFQFKNYKFKLGCWPIRTECTCHAKPQ